MSSAKERVWGALEARAERIEEQDGERLYDALTRFVTPLVEWHELEQADGKTVIQSFGSLKTVGIGSAIEVAGVGLDLTVVGVEIGAVLNWAGGVIIGAAPFAQFITPNVERWVGEKLYDKRPGVMTGLGLWARDTWPDIEWYLFEDALAVADSPHGTAAKTMADVIAVGGASLSSDVETVAPTMVTPEKPADNGLIGWVIAGVVGLGIWMLS